MSDQTDKYTSMLEPFGLSEDEARIYLVLLEQGVLSALQISRELKLGRTKVYRLLDRLIEFGLVSNQFDEVGFKFVAQPPEKLELLVNMRQAEIKALKKSLPKIQEGLMQSVGSKNKGSKVRYYQGKRGLVQVNFNLLRAKGEVLSYELETADAFMSKAEAEEMRREIVKNRIMVRTITNATHIKPFTQVKELVRDYWQIRHIDKSRFTIGVEMFIYNDVYLLYHYTDNDVFCVEIYNQVLASMQRQQFEWMWREARELKILNDEGEARLIG